MGKSGLPSIRKATFSGTITDPKTGKKKFYSGLTQKELEKNKLAFNTLAKEDKFRTGAVRGKKKTSRELFDYLAKGKKELDLGRKGVAEAVGQISRANRSARVRTKKVREEQLKNKPSLSWGKLLSMAGATPEGKADYTVYTNSKGQVIGISDPFRRQTYRITPTSKAKVKQFMKERQLEIDESERKKGFIRRAVEKLPTKLGDLRKLIKEEKDALRKAKTGKYGNKFTYKPFSKLSRLQAKKNFYIIAGQVIKNIDSFISLPTTISFLAKNPSYLKKIPSELVKSSKRGIKLVKTNPDEALLILGTEILLMKGTGAFIERAGKVINAGLVRLSPKFVGSLKKGNVLNIKLGGGKNAKLQVAGKIPKQKLSEQVKLAGKKVNAISSQADELLTLTKRNKVIRKPITARKGSKVIPESDFAPKTKRLLAKFDAGKIKRNELIELDELIKKEGAKGILERQFFADPSGIIRPSRLGVLAKRDAGIYDVLKGNFTLKRNRPQILFFNDVPVEKFPKNLKKVSFKIKKGLPLTRKETKELLKFQNKVSGKFKPVGFLTKESEVTLAPNELIRRVKVIGISIIDGKKVPIVQVEIIKPKGKLAELIKKLRKTPDIKDDIDKIFSKLKRNKKVIDKIEKRRISSNKKIELVRKRNLKKEVAKLEQQLKKKKKEIIKKNEISELNRKLKKKTGLDYNLSSYSNSKPYLNLNKLYSRVLKYALSLSRKLSRYKLSKLSKAPSRLSRARKTSRASKTSKVSRPKKTSKASRPSKVSRASKTSKVSKPSKVSKTSKVSRPKKTSKASRPSKVSRASKTSKVNKIIKIPIKLPEFSWDKKPPKGMTYVVNAIIRVKGKNRTIPLKTTPNRALKLIGKRVDTSTARSFKLKIIGLTKKKDIKKPSVVSKFRKKKSKGTPVLGVVEKTKHAIDTRGEKKSLKTARKVKRRKKRAKKTKSSSLRKARSKKRTSRKKKK